MRIRTRIILTLVAASLTLMALAAISLSTSWRLAELSRAQQQAQAAAYEVSALLVLTHEYALHVEPRAEYQWQKRIESLLQALGAREANAGEALEQAHAIRELFAQLVLSNANENTRLKQQRSQILLGQLLTNTQALADRIHRASIETAKKREAAENIVQVTGLATPLISLLVLGLIFALLATRVLRPLGLMRKAVQAVSQGDLSIRSNTGTRDEFGELSRAFDTMALDLVTQLREEINERKQIENNLQKIVRDRALQLAELEQLKTTLDQTVDCVFMFDTGQLRFHYVNQGAISQVGYSHAELMQMHPYDIKPDIPREKFIALIQPLLAGTQAKLTFETVHRHKAGHRVPVEVLLQHIARPGQPPHFVAVVRDISERKLVEETLINHTLELELRVQQRTAEMKAARDEAERANQAKSEFLSSMSHELRTPMNAILGYGQLMGFDETLPATHRDNVQEILKAGYHLLELINEVLDLARVESGHLDLTLEAVEVCTIVDDCLSLVETLASKRGISISHHGLKGAVVRADRIRLKQILLNLLSNAVKYNREGGSVQLEVQQQGAERLRILVTDTGHGIAAERMHELFQPFSRLEASNSAIEGTGIGLTITRRIVEKMGGSVNVVSEAGVGSTFWIDLPLSQAATVQNETGKVADNDTALPSSSHDTVQDTILYIEDNPANLRLMEQIIGKRKHSKLISAHTGEWGIELAQAYRPDLILLDINMLGLDGYQVLEILKASPALKDIPVFAITANAMNSDIERGMAAGFTAYLTKPLDVYKFHALLDSLLGAEDESKT